jgi:hypothetical protein
MDADLYSSTKYIFNVLKNYIDKDFVIVFDGDKGEQRILSIY